MLWVRVYALLNFLSQISFYWSQGTAFSSMGWFKPRSIVPFQCVAKHDLGFLGWGSRGGGGGGFVHVFGDDQDWTNVSEQTFSLICLFEHSGYLGFPGDMSRVAQLQRVQHYF